MKTIKYLVVLVCMTLGMANVVKAQVKNSEVMFFQKGKNFTAVVRIVDGDLYAMTCVTSTVKSHLKDNRNYYDNLPNVPYIAGGSTPQLYIINNDMSTNSRMVYENEYLKRKGYNGKFYAIATDFSSLIYFETYPNHELKESSKEYFIRTQKEDLLPQTPNPNDFDFLND